MLTGSDPLDWFDHSSSAVDLRLIFVAGVSVCRCVGMGFGSFQMAADRVSSRNLTICRELS